MSFFDRLGNALEGRGKTILYTLGAIILGGILVVLIVNWRNRKADEARQALGRAIEIQKASISPAPIPGRTEVTFASEKDRAQRAIEEFQKVADKYGDPYRAESRYFIASNRLVLDRQKGMTELAELGNSDVEEVAALSKFALAQANESDGKFDEAARLYSELAKLNSVAVPAETANLRLAKVYEKQGKQQQAADLLFNIVDASRKAKGPDNKALPQSAAAREAAEELQRIAPERYAQLPPETASLAG